MIWLMSCRSALGGRDPSAQPAEAALHRDAGAPDLLDRSATTEREGDVEHTGGRGGRLHGAGEIAAVPLADAGDLDPGTGGVH